MAIANRISEQEYRELALNEPDFRWELWDGVLVEKPLMSMKHEDVASYLGYLLQNQLDRGVYRVHINGGRTRYTSRNYYIPDVVVIPAAFVLPVMSDPRSFDAFAEPLPLVVEVWSPSTGAYDTRTKLPLYLARGDREIWFVDPFERTLSASVRRADGTYEETIHTAGIVECASLPGVRVDLGALFG